MDALTSTWPLFRAMAITFAVGVHASFVLPWMLDRQEKELAKETHRLVLEGKGDGDEWEVLYQPGDAENDLLHDVLAYRRLRTLDLASSDRPGRTYHNFTRWVARQALLVRPDIESVRVQQVRDPTDGTKRAPYQRTWTRRKVGL